MIALKNDISARPQTTSKVVEWDIKREDQKKKHGNLLKNAITF
jgi:hypothetical protein